MTDKIKKIKVEKQPLKFIKKQEASIRDEFKVVIKNFPVGDIVELSGKKGYYRAKLGGKLKNFRIIFTIDEDEILIEYVIQAIGNRGDIYKHTAKSK